MAIAKRSLVMMVALLCVMAGVVSAGTVFNAGGGGGWNLGQDMAAVSMSSGDIVKFVYPSKEHNVCQVSQDDFEKCNVNSPIVTYNSGEDYVTLYSPGTYYYVCGVSEHCGSGMKLIVYVH